MSDGRQNGRQTSACHTSAGRCRAIARSSGKSAPPPAWPAQTMRLLQMRQRQQSDRCGLPAPRASAPSWSRLLESAATCRLSVKTGCGQKRIRLRFVTWRVSRSMLALESPAVLCASCDSLGLADACSDRSCLRLASKRCDLSTCRCRCLSRKSSDSRVADPSPASLRGFTVGLS